MRKLIAYFIKYPIYANAIIIITAIAGILSFTMMPKSFFPELPPNKIYINVSYPGASPQEIEHGITTRIEESLNGIEGVEEESHQHHLKTFQKYHCRSRCWF